MDNLENYTIIIDFDPDSGWYVAEVLELPGCKTRAADILTLRKNIHQAIAAYAENNP